MHYPHKAGLKTRSFLHQYKSLNSAERDTSAGGGGGTSASPSLLIIMKPCRGSGRVLSAMALTIMVNNHFNFTATDFVLPQES